MAYLQFETKTAVNIIPLNLKIQQKRPLLVCSLLSKEIFWKFTMLLKCLRAANERWTFSRTDSVLILKIGWVEPLSLSFWKLLEEAVFENGAGYSRTPLFRTRLIRSPRYFEGRSNALGFTLPLYASRLFRSPAISNVFPFPLGLRNSGVRLYSRIYLSYLGCKFDFFTCLLVMVMIKTNTTRKQLRIKRSPYGNLPGCKQGTDI